MSLTISPQGFIAGFNPKAYPIVAPPEEDSSNSAANTNSTNADVKVDLSHLEVIKIIPEEATNGGSNVSSDRSLVNNKAVFSSNLNSDELVKKIDPETREEVRKTSGTNQ